MIHVHFHWLIFGATLRFVKKKQQHNNTKTLILSLNIWDTFKRKISEANNKNNKQVGTQNGEK